MNNDLRTIYNNYLETVKKVLESEFSFTADYLKRHNDDLTQSEKEQYVNQYFSFTEGVLDLFSYTNSDIYIFVDDLYDYREKLYKSLKEVIK